MKEPAPPAPGHDRTALGHPLDDVLPGEARVLEAAQEALAGRRRGARGALPFLGPAFIAAVAYVDPGNFATNMAGGATVRLPPALGRAHRQPDGDADPVDERQARDRHRQEPPRGVSGAVLAAGLGRALAAGRGDRDGDRHRGVHRCRDRAEPPLRDRPLPGGADHERRRLRDPRAPEPRLPPARGRDHGVHPGDRRRLRLPGVRRGSEPEGRRRGLDPGLRRHGERAARGRDPRGDRDAARDLPPLGADAAPHRRRDRGGEAADLPVRARRRRDRDGDRRRDQHEHADHRRRGLLHERAHRHRRRPRHRLRRAPGRARDGSGRSSSASRCSPPVSRPRASGRSPGRS